MTYHIRRPLRYAGGGQWYRDKSDRGQGTFCGAAETAYDVTARDRAPAWDGHTPCPDCLLARAEATAR